MAAEAQDRMKKVKDFIREAFPESTIPIDTARRYRDYSFNFVGHPYWAKPRERTSVPCAPKGPKELEERIAQFPSWPADLFAVTSALLERSCVYQHLANAISPIPEDNEDDPDWPQTLQPSIKPAGDDPFGVYEPHRLLLRLIGTLWSHGALMVSGLYFGDTLCSPADIGERNAARARAASAFLKEQMSREIEVPALEAAEKAIYKHICDRLKLVSLAPELDDPKDLCPTAASHLAFQALKIHDENHRAGQAPTIVETESYYRSDGEGFRKIRTHALIIWASHYIQYHWNVLRESPRPIAAPTGAERNPEDEDWWRAATRLLIIADEAGKGMGFSVRAHRGKSSAADKLRHKEGGKPPEFAPGHSQVGLDCRTIWEHFLEAQDIQLGRRHTKKFPRTLTRVFEEDLGAVLPKAHLPANGCTIRSLSHNFALLPTKGRVRARWGRQATPLAERTTYNILLVPYPYHIQSRHVKITSTEKSRDDWGFFKIESGWLYEAADGKKDQRRARVQCRSQFWNFLKSLLRDQVDNTVHAIVLPECALDWETFDLVQRKLLEDKQLNSVEMLVCGLTSARTAPGAGIVSGNYVATYMRAPDSKDTRGRPSWGILHVRDKHHRWRVDARQLENYALSHRLPPDKTWWEDIRLPPREMLFAEFSPGSIATTLICEDLARIEPCQVALRAVGPNLVLVLLMDNAQVVARWPHQYAGVLADDPGSSVLTLTSFGLIHRSNVCGDRESRQIALWREPQSGPAKEIKLPAGHHAQLISIKREYCFERTLDGRGDNHDSAIKWTFAGLMPIKAQQDPPGGKAD
jgi:hypothetical protein